MSQTITTETRIEITAGHPVELPGGEFVANAQMTRVGLDLHLTAPDGHSVIVEGYFAQQGTAPDLVTADGAKLSPQLVSAFVPPEHAGQYAASGQIANDATPVGHITEVSGEAHIVRADGTHVPAAVNTPLYQGDVIETSKAGAVNLQFADNTSFAISESARMSVDKFIYDSAHHSGSSFFSMLQGVFVYTSGLIGKADPGSVSIETPVGSIGIRGTVVAGHIMPAGQESKITILDGAITVTNGSGTHEMHESFNTVALNNYQSAPTNLGQMDAHTFHESFHSVAAVAGDTVSHFTAAAAAAPAHAAEHGAADAPPPAPANAAHDAPPAAAPPAPAGDHSAKPPVAPVGEDHAPQTAPADGMMAPMMAPPPVPAGDHATMNMAPPMAPVMAPAMMMAGMDMMAMTGYKMMSAATGMTGMLGTATNFYDTATSFAPPPVMTAYTAPIIAGSTTTYTTTTTTLTATTDTTIQPVATSGGTSYVVPFSLSFSYSSDYQTLGGIKEFAAMGTFVGHVTPYNAAAGDIKYMVTVNGANLPVQIVPDGPSGGYSPSTNYPYATAFSMDSLGNVYANDPLGLSHYVNPNGLNLTITATDGLGHTAVMSPWLNIQNGSPNPANPPQIFVGTDGSDTLSVSNLSYGYIDGGSGNDTLLLAMTGAAASTIDLATANLGPIKNIETIDLGTSGTGLHLGVREVYQMTDSNHALTITSTAAAALSIITGGTGDFQLQDGGTIGASSTLHYRGTYNNSTVDLVINNAATSSNLTGITVTDVAHTLAPPSFAFDSSYNTPVINTGSYSSGSGVAEFAASGTVVGTAHLSAPAGDAVSYSVAKVVDTYTGTTIGVSPFSFSTTAAGSLIVGTGYQSYMSYHDHPPGFDVTIAANDTTTGQTTFLTEHIALQNYLPGVAPYVLTGGGSYTGTGVADFIVNTGSSSFSVSGGGGGDVILGGGGNDTITVADNAFRYIDGGAGNDLLTLGSGSGPIALDMTDTNVDPTVGSRIGSIRNIETINLGTNNVFDSVASRYEGNILSLIVRDVFDMTSSSNHTLTITANNNVTYSTVNVYNSTSNGYFALRAGDYLTGTHSTVHYDGTYNGTQVTLVINNAVSTGHSIGDISVNVTTVL
ncbi:MAG: FecR domain-containing protein [Proteobacteria bacterium]|nr:FecR domain-containing protein [Pseudomonadota bacterium]